MESSQGMIVLRPSKEEICFGRDDRTKSVTDDCVTRFKYGLLCKHAVPGYGRPRRFNSLLDKEEGLLRANVRGEFHSIDDESTLEIVIDFRRGTMHCSTSDENYQIMEPERMIKDAFGYVKKKRLSSIPKVVDRILGISASPQYLLEQLEKKYPRGLTKEEKKSVVENAKRLWPKKCNELYQEPLFLVSH